MQYEYVDEKGKAEGHQESWDSNLASLIKDVLKTFDHFIDFDVFFFC